MASEDKGTTVTRKQLIDLLNQDLAREYQAIIAYVVYSQALKGAQYMSIAKELEVHAGEELQHALTIAKQVDYLGGMPAGQALPVVLTDDRHQDAAGRPRQRERHHPQLSRAREAVRGPG